MTTTTTTTMATTMPTECGTFEIIQFNFISVKQRTKPKPQTKLVCVWCMMNMDRVDWTLDEVKYIPLLNELIKGR